MAYEAYGQHAIPQEISSYQFRLVGDMTLKQFFQIAAGALIAILFYSSNLPGFVKWPIIIVSVLMGAALAFFKLEDRPLEVWIIAFLKSIYSPTVFTWRTPTKPYAYFKPEQHAPLNAFANTAMQNQSTDTVQSPVAINQKQNESVADVASSAPIGFTQEASSAVTELEQSESQLISQISEHFGDVENNSPRIVTQETEGKTPIAEVNSDNIHMQNQSNDVSIPQNSATTIAPQMPHPLYNEPAPVATPEEVDTVVHTVQMNNPTISTDLPNQATFSPQAAPPVTPTRPNIIVGQVLDTEGKIIEGAILEITDNTGRPVRAIKTNQLGHFGIVTPLFEGSYTIHTEKDGFHFNPVMFAAQNSIIEPIAITGNKSQTIEA